MNSLLYSLRSLLIKRPPTFLILTILLFKEVVQLSVDGPDEPTGSLDEKNRNLILNTFRGIHEEGMTIILVTHDPTVAQLSNKKYIMKDGLLYSELGVCDENY